MRLEELKQELINQKQAIESKGGKVVVANANPSPSEITAGIGSIIPAGVDFGSVTATADDVVKGKTFYTSAGELVEGTFEDMFKTYYLVNPSTSSNGQVIDLKLPDSLTVIRPYLISKLPCSFNVWLSPETTEIGIHSLENSSKVCIKNWHELTKLTTIKDYGCQTVSGIDFSQFPDTLTKLGDYAVYNAKSTVNQIVYPNNIISTNLGDYIYGMSPTVTFEKMVWPSTIKSTKIAEGMFYGCLFTEDIVVPENFTIIARNGFYEGGSKNVTLPKSIKELGENCLSTSRSTPTILTITFLNETPPTYTNKIVSKNHVNLVKFYVPDNAVDAYKSAFPSNLILPMSEKP